MKGFLRKINARITAKRLAACILCFAVVNFGLIINGEYRRDAAVKDLKSTYRMSRQMLNSRARIQIILINASLEGRRLNPTEIDLIKQNRHRAEYDPVTEE